MVALIHNLFKISQLKYLLLLITTFILQLGYAQAQSDQELKNSYEYGKKLLSDRKYAAAKDVFYKLTQTLSNNIYEKHAYYFFAYSTYQSGDKVNAKQYLQKMIEKFPSFNDIDEAKYLLGVVHLDLGELKQGIEVLNTTKKSGLNENIKLAKQNFLYKANTETLKSLYSQLADETLGKILAQKLINQRLNAEEKALLNTLNQKYGQTSVVQNSNVTATTPILKPSYNFGIFLPFMQENSTPTQTNRRYQFVYDMYEGMKMAQQDLEKEGIKVKLFAFDTERNDTTVRELVKKEWNSEIDLIVGALYPNNTKELVKLAEVKKINIVNPLGNDSELIKNNPYLFLCEATPETQGIKAAEFAISNFAGKNALIYYGNNLQDSLIAYAYQKKLQQDPNYKVVIQKLKTKVGYYNYLNDLNKIAKTDSAHLFICSDDEGKAANFVSALRSARRGFPILTYPTWLDFSQLSFDQFEELRVHFLMTNQYIRFNKEAENFKREYINHNQMFPSKFAYIGYETIYYFGKMMSKYGTNFQDAIKRNGYEKGRITAGFNFYNSNDNLCITICKLNEGEFEVVNLPLMDEVIVTEEKD